MKKDESLADDNLRGCEAIAEFVGLNPRQAFLALQKGRIPAFKQGRLWIASKQRIRRFYAESTYKPQQPDNTPGEHQRG